MSEKSMSEGGEDTETSVVSSDDSKQEQLERELLQAQRLRELSMYAGDIGRDFNSILRSVRIYLQMCQEDLSEGHIVQEYLSQALHELQQAEDLVGNLLRFIQSENTDVQEEDLSSLVKRVLQFVEPSFPESIALRTRFEEPCPVIGDAAQLQQVALNLISNAWQSMEGQWDERPTVLEVIVQQVHVDAELAERYLDLEPGRYAHLMVSDTGSGMDPGTQERVNEQISTMEEGRESGLPVVNGIVEAHDGAITVRTESGKGTTFNIYLPLAPEAKQEPSDSLSRDASGDRRHILVVDDDQLIRDLEGDRLPRLGYDVTTKVDGREALKAVENRPDAFDVILIDYRMPKMNGLELVHVLRDSGCDLPIILMTGFGAQVSEAEARMVGVDQLVQKPIEIEELDELLRQIG